MLKYGTIKAFFLALPLAFSISQFTLGQGLSTEGKDFWVGFMSNWNQSNNNPIILELYISANDTTSGTVTMPRQSGFTPISFKVYPNTTSKILIPTSLAMANGSNIIEEKGIHIETDKNVSVYAMNKRQYSADMTVVLPTYSLGNNYFVLSHWEDGNRNNNANSDSEFLVVGITDSTEIEITPTHETINGNPAHVPFRVHLHKGQTYQLRAKGDLTGSQLVATNQSGCQNFAVFSGNMYTQVGECNVRNGHDHLYAQMYPTNTLGKEFIVVPLENRFGGDIIKFLATQDNTTIEANGTIYNLDAMEFIKILSPSVLSVSSDKPIAIGQYSRTMDCDATLGDPFLIPISPNEQLLKKITFNAPSIATLSEYSLNIITKQDEISNITFDGQSISSRFSPVEDSEYAYARINTIGGNHTIKSDDGFIAYVYGFGHNESFGYATGASLGNLNIDFTIHDQNEETPIDSLCLGSEISFSPLADTIYTLFEYDFGDGNIIITDTDSTVYHKYAHTGEYLVSLTASTGGNDCSNGNEETSLKIIRVIEPSAVILGPRSVCPNTSDAAYFIEVTETDSYDWFVSGGLLGGVTADSIFVDWGSTNNNAQVQLISTNRYGCISDMIRYPVKINIQLDPEAPFGSDTLCSNTINEVPYLAYFTEASTYQWESDFAEISGGNGSNSVMVDWESYGHGKIWFHQISITDTVCDGSSDTLQVYIQRNPSDMGEIITEKDTFQIGEPITFDLVADSLFRFANWVIDEENQYDTMAINQPIYHEFLCEGNYTIHAIAYDTGTICSDTKAFIDKEIFIMPIDIEIEKVTVAQPEDDAINIHWNTIYTSFFPKTLDLYRRIKGEDDWKLISNIDPDHSMYKDTEMSIYETSYEYKIETNHDCEKIVESSIHPSVLLHATTEENYTEISWNQYEGWTEGVKHYEIWINTDSSEYVLKETTSDTKISYKYQDEGFNFCYVVKAIELDGNNATSVSNSSCVDFVPEIKTYNVITPNTSTYNDDKNENFNIDNIEHYPQSRLTILNRYGRVIFQTTGYKNNWNGKVNGSSVPSGIYYYELELNEPRNEIKTIKGYFSIVY